MILRILLALFLSFGFLQSASLLTYNFYSKDDYFDIVLSFNEAYNGQIRQQNLNGKTILFLDNIELKEDFSQNYNSKILKSVSFFAPEANMLQIELKSQSPLIISAAKSPDKFGMRIKVSKKAVESFSELGAQKGTKVDNKYITVIIFLAVLAAALFFVKRKIIKKKISLKKNIQNAPKSAETEQTKQSEKGTDFSKIAENFGIKSQPNQNVKIIFEKNLDEKNKVMLLEHEERKYLVLVGNSNVVLDRFGEDGIHTMSDFENFFAQNKQKLSNYLMRHQNSLENYKNKLSQEDEKNWIF